jgi:hypothetical protein
MPLDAPLFPQEAQSDPPHVQVTPVTSNYGFWSIARLILGKHINSPEHDISLARGALEHLHQSDTSWWVRVFNETLADFALTCATNAYIMGEHAKSLTEALNAVHERKPYVQGLTRNDITVLAEALYLNYKWKKKYNEDLAPTRHLIRKCYLIAKAIGDQTSIVHVAYYIRLVEPDGSEAKMAATLLLGTFARDHGIRVALSGTAHEKYVLELCIAVQYQARSARAFELLDTASSHFE